MPRKRAPTPIFNAGALRDLARFESPADLERETGRSKIVDYIVEEVRRQQHDVTQLDGLERVGWMLGAWCWALRISQVLPDPGVSEAIELGRMIEPMKNERGIRTIPVMITGGGLKPDADTIARSLESLFEHGGSLSPIEFYKEFELIHPFVDGNGRTGKILLAWKARRLLDPFFPPADLFGAPIINP